MSDNGEESASLTSSIRTSLDRAHHFIDTHPRTVKYGAYSIGAVGLVILFRSVHAGKAFRHGSEIPKLFIKKGVHLQGRVKEIHSDGLIYVQHIPIIEFKFPWQQHQRPEYLPMTLAYVDLTPDGSKDWLKKMLLHKNVWFQVLKVEKENNVPLETAIFSQKFIFWKTCINEKIIELGLCKVASIPEEEIKLLNKNQTKLLDRMIAVEKIADKKGRGIWKEEKPPLSQTVKKYLYMPVIISKLLYEKAKTRLRKSKFDYRK